MEQKIIIRMFLGFAAFTLLAITGVYILALDVTSILPSQTTKLSASEPKPIVISPKPTPKIPETTVTQKKAVAGAATTQPQPTSSTKIDAQKIYSLINAHRKEQNLSVLRTHSSLEQSSRKKIEDMIAQHYWQHENPQGVMDWQIFERSGYHYATAGENLSFGNNTPWEVFSAWVASPTHNEQLLNSEYEDMGLAYDCNTYKELGDVSCVVVLHLGKQKL